MVGAAGIPALQGREDVNAGRNILADRFCFHQGDAAVRQSAHAVPLARLPKRGQRVLGQAED
jgi:hypothetical protein